MGETAGDLDTVQVFTQHEVGDCCGECWLEGENQVEARAARLIQALHTPLTILFVTICASACMAAVGLLIGVASRSREQATAFSLVLMFVLAGLGDAWVLIQFTGTAFWKLARTAPGAWIVDAYENVVQRGLSLPSALLSCSLLPVSPSWPLFASADNQPDVQLGAA